MSDEVKIILTFSEFRMIFNLTFCVYLWLVYFLYFRIMNHQVSQNHIRNVNNILLLALLLLRRNERRTHVKRFWVRDIFKNRRNQGAYHNLLQEMRLTDTEKYFNYLRMSSVTFQSLLNIVGPKLNRTYCVREPIYAGERLAVTLR